MSGTTVSSRCGALRIPRGCQPSNDNNDSQNLRFVRRKRARRPRIAVNRCLNGSLGHRLCCFESSVSASVGLNVDQASARDIVRLICGVAG
jgi:hypothetical protein